MAGNTAGRVATDSGQGRPPATRRRWPAVLTPKRTLAIVIGAIALWFILVNRATVSLTLWVSDVTAPLWVVLLITFAAGLLAGLLLGRNKKKRN